MKILLMRSRLLSILYDSISLWDTVLCNNTKNSQCSQGNCEDCADGKKVIVNIDPGKNVFLKRKEIY